MSDANAWRAYSAAIPRRRDSLGTLNSGGFFIGNNLVGVRRRGLRRRAVAVIRGTAGPAVGDASGPAGASTRATGSSTTAGSSPTSRGASTTTSCATAATSTGPLGKRRRA
jgi:hypothetical protein